MAKKRLTKAQKEALKRRSEAAKKGWETRRKNAKKRPAKPTKLPPVKSIKKKPAKKKPTKRQLSERAKKGWETRRKNKEKRGIEEIPSDELLSELLRRKVEREDYLADLLTEPGHGKLSEIIRSRLRVYPTPKDGYEEARDIAYEYGLTVREVYTLFYSPEKFAV